MRRRILILGAGIISTTLSFSQIKKQFSVDNDRKVEKVDLKFKVNSGQCFIKPGETSDLLNVYSNQDFDSYSHSFEKETNRETCKINLALEDNKSQGLSQSISYRMFGKSESTPEKIWKVYLTEDKAYNLNLNYGIGHANIDLSGLSVEKLKVFTGSADVVIDYENDGYNKVEMDTFYVKVDLGSVAVKKLNLSKSRNVVADIGFGNLTLDFSDKPEVASNIKSSVAAGNLLILLPPAETPVMIKVTDSWLCRVKLTKSFKNLGNNTFVNAAYTKDAEDVLTFNLDVSMGSIEFRDK
ncbi:hypothetical protein E1176_14005 [Fulvivirga sp. RKSG066]|uniref:hypothetical protein n=1 Tax=Fulvivirga aurantia TaxID=2529383 RepID=UPI0012BC48A0|nr:hypothetical protein [Fulvivirga aurantia]MTI22140.1 hypothetical protein [Fulvivirga aurantia]